MNNPAKADTDTGAETEFELPGAGEEVVRTPTEHILTHQEGDEALDEEEVSDAMLAGWNKAGGGDDASKKEARTTTPNDDGAGETDITDLVAGKTGTEGGDAGSTGSDDGKPNPGAQQQVDDDPDVPGLGMKASQVKAALGRLDALEKSTASTAGHLGHLKQLVTQAGKGKEVTAASLANIAKEFGEEFAEAMAKDLSGAGFGAGATLDPAAVQAMVDEKVAQATELTRRDLEKRAVQRVHKDADDHFAKPVVNDKGEVTGWTPGSKNVAFMAFIGTLPADRQRELGENGWDSDVVIRALDEFKAHEKKAATSQAKQAARVNRAVAPTSSGGARVLEPTVDSLEEGWANVRGKSRAARAASGVRR
jgi:hypothetical protein